MQTRATEHRRVTAPRGKTDTKPGRKCYLMSTPVRRRHPKARITAVLLSKPYIEGSSICGEEDLRLH